MINVEWLTKDHIEVYIDSVSECIEWRRFGDCWYSHLGEYVHYVKGNAVKRQVCSFRYAKKQALKRMAKHHA